MKALKSVFFLFVIGMVLALTQCGGATEPVVSDQGNTEPIYTVMADEHLQTGHKEAILRALNAWATDTHNTFTYQLTFVDMSKEPANLDTPYTIKIYVKDPGPGYLGWTTWSSNHASYTLVEPSIDAELFRRIMLHELGHSFALSFTDGDPHYKGPYESVMHPSIGEDSLHLSCPELQAFCTAYNCQVDCTNVAQGTATTDVAWKETCE